MGNIARKLIDLWDNDDTLQEGVPYRRMATEAAQVFEAENKNLNAELDKSLEHRVSLFREKDALRARVEAQDAKIKRLREAGERLAFRLDGFRVAIDDETRIYEMDSHVSDWWEAEDQEALDTWRAALSESEDK